MSVKRLSFLRLSVPYGITSIIISATPHHAGATITGTGSHTLNEGANSITIAVTAKDGVTQKNYTITVNRDKGNSTSSFKDETLQLYPNPATEHITISGLQANEILRFYNINGILLFIKEATQETETISIGHLSAGVYLVKTGGGVITVVKK